MANVIIGIVAGFAVGVIAGAIGFALLITKATQKRD
jgi:hypothetical protein